MGGSEYDYFRIRDVYDGMIYSTIYSESADLVVPASRPNTAVPDPFPNQSGGTEIFLAKINSAAPIVDADGPVSGTVGSPLSLSSNAVAGDLATDLSGSIVWTDESGNVLGTGPNLAFAAGDLAAGSHKFVASVEDPSSGLTGIDGVFVEISDAPATIQFVIDDVSVVEGNSGANVATFKVTRTGDTSVPASFQYETQDGSATAPSDYVDIALTTLNFAAGETAKTIDVTINGDTEDEGDETFLVNLSSPSVGASITDPQGIARLRTMMHRSVRRCTSPTWMRRPAKAHAENGMQRSRSPSST